MDDKPSLSVGMRVGNESDGEDIAMVGRPTANAAVDETLADDLAVFDLSLKKKKKKKKSKKVEVKEDEESYGIEGGRPWDGSDRDYGYTEVG